MLKFPNAMRSQPWATIVAASVLSITATTAMAQSKLGLGRTALPEEIAAWDIDVLPDGRGLPAGSGNAFDGEEIFAEKCAACHGDFAEGVDNWPPLAGGQDTLADKDPVKTVGSYWPYLSTVFDYVNRSMPFGEAQTLTSDEVYAIVAYIMYSNDVIDDEFELSRETFLDVPMHNADGFVIDDRAELEYPEWRTEPCMENCKPSVEITMHASVLNVTPEEEAAEGEQVEEQAVVTPPAPEATPEPEPEEQVAALDPELIAAGEKVFKKCRACHTVGEGAKNKSGPQLNGIVGQTLGSVEGYKYSKAFKSANEEGQAWDEEALAAFLTKPKSFIKGTKMGFAGLKKDDEIEAIIAYLKSFGG